MDIPPFEGFTTEAIQFIDEWRRHNSREWFQPQKSEYEKLIKNPAVSFINDLGSRLKLLSRDINFDLGNNGSLLRIYRDVRFSQDKSPYNPNIRMVFWEGARKKTDNPGFFIKFDQKGGGVFAGMHMFDKGNLNTFRDAVIDPAHGPKLIEAVEAVGHAGDYLIGGDYFKRVPRGYDADHERADLLRYNGLYAMNMDITVQDLFSPDLVDICFQHCVNMRPIQQWLVDVLAV